MKNLGYFKITTSLEAFIKKTINSKNQARLLAKADHRQFKELDDEAVFNVMANKGFSPRRVNKTINRIACDYMYDSKKREEKRASKAKAANVTN